MAKSPDAFRTISEVADWLGIQAHVLRFWESKFTQVKPIKRAGGRRYYRPSDMLLLGGIRQLLHEDGLTIKGVQKILREEGMSHVASLSQPLDELTQSQLDDDIEAPIDIEAEVIPESAVVLSFEAPAQKESREVPQDIAAETSIETEPLAAMPPLSEDAPVIEQTEEPATQTPEPDQVQTDVAQDDDLLTGMAQDAPPATTGDDPAPDAAEPATEGERPAAALPAFLRRPMTAPAAVSDNAPPDSKVEPPEPPAAAPRPRDIGMPALTPFDRIEARPAVLTNAFRARSLSTQQAAEIAPLLDRLTVLRDSMAAHRRSAGAANPDA
jgi:DNA-binding transcriptional MerR regulator